VAGGDIGEDWGEDWPVVAGGLVSPAVCVSVPDQ
jgi:hypothetical protein